MILHFKKLKIRFLKLYYNYIIFSLLEWYKILE